MDRTLVLIGRAHQGDKAARDLLFEENTGLIYSVAKRFLGRGVEMEDLFQGIGSKRTAAHIYVFSGYDADGNCGTAGRVPGTGVPHGKKDTGKAAGENVG